MLPTEKATPRPKFSHFEEESGKDEKMDEDEDEGEVDGSDGGGDGD